VGIKEGEGVLQFEVPWGQHLMHAFVSFLLKKSNLGEHYKRTHTHALRTREKSKVSSVTTTPCH
jgi:hypothetical protein